MEKLFFRTDFNEKIGFGHLYRCFSIAEIVEKKYQIIFVFNRSITTDFFSELKKYKTLFIENDYNFYCLLKPDNFVVIDSYNFNENHQKELNKRGVKLIVIDDLNSMVYDCDAIINHGIFYKKDDYNCNFRTRLYLGLDYLMVRKEFRKFSQSNRILIPPKKYNSVFICFGGSDQIELINNTIEILIENGISIFNILINENFVNKIVEIESDKIKINTYGNLKPNNIIKLILKSDFAILPASTILLEAFTIGIPVISGWFVNNQQFSLSEFEKKGLIVNINQFNSKGYKIKLTKALFLLKTKSDIIKNQKRRIKLNDHNFLNIFNDIAQE